MSEPTLEQLKRDYIKALDLIASMRQERDEAQAHECPSVFNQHWSKEAEFDKAVIEAARIKNINGYAISTNPDNPIYAEIDRLKVELAKTHWLKEQAEAKLAEAIQVIDESNRMIVDEDTGRRWKELYMAVAPQLVKLEEQRRVGAEAVRELFGIADIVNSFPETPGSDGLDGALGRRVKGLVEQLRQELADAQTKADRAMAEAAELRQGLERVRNHWPPGPVRPFDVTITLTANEQYDIHAALASSILAADHLAKARRALANKEGEPCQTP